MNNNLNIKNINSFLNKKNIIVISIIILLTIGSYFLYLEIRPKFKNITIELGTEKVTLNSFLVSSMYKDDAKILTDLSKVNLSKTSEVNIKLSYKGKEETVKLTIVDTKPPEVIFQNISRYSGYIINPKDFILNLDDLVDTTITSSNIEDTSEYKDYEIEITVTDKNGNKTKQTCTLTIAWLKPLFYLELGEDFTKELILEDINKYGDTISQKEIDKVDVLIPSEYFINAIYKNKNYTSQVIIKDTIPPELELKDVTIYVGKKVDKDDFIKLAKDKSNDVTTLLKKEIDYSIIGEQEIIIVASDKSGNTIEKAAKLNIIKDTKGPVFSGLKDISASKNSTINYTSGVKAIDANDGSCKFSINSSKVNTAVAGTYYVTYTSKDSNGNITTRNRKVVIKHDQTDTNNKFNTFYNNYLSGKSVYEMASIIKTKIRYDSSWGGDDPVWYGLTNNSGNCYVHALILQKALNKVGVTNKLIYVTNKSHYWNLVYTNGIWRHYDSTPGTHIIGPATDDVKFNSSAMRGRNWDRSVFPVAN